MNIEQFYIQYEHKLRVFIASILGSRIDSPDVYDILHGAILRADKNWDKFENRSTNGNSIYSWVKVIVKNYAMDQLSKKRNTYKKYIHLQNEIAEDRPNICNNMYPKEFVRYLGLLWPELSTNRRILIVLLYMGLTNDEIAEILKVKSTGVIERRKYKLKKKLSDLVKNLF